MTEAIRLDAAARYVPPTSEQLAAARDIADDSQNAGISREPMICAS